MASAAARGVIHCRRVDCNLIPVLGEGLSKNTSTSTTLFIKSNRLQKHSCTSSRRPASVSIVATLDIPNETKSGAQLREEYFLAAATGKERGLPKGAFLNDDVVDGPEVEITFEPYGDSAFAPEGSSLLKAAVDAGAMKIDQRFCLTGQCDVCILEMEDGEVLRSCMRAVPSGKDRITCLVLDSDDAWGQMMV